MKKSKNRRKLNNHGMSLIEVLVAIMILAIVTGPLLQSLVTGIKLNARAKEKQRLTTAAQSIMEGLKAYDIEHICMQFNHCEGWDMRLIATENVGSYYEIGGIDDHNGDGIINLDEVSIKDGTFLPAADGTYAFALENVKFVGVEDSVDKFYDAKIEIWPNTVWNSSPEGSVSDGTVDLIDMVNMNEYLDAVYKQPANMDQTVYTLILDEFLDYLNEENESGDKFDLHDLEVMVKSEKNKVWLTVNKVITVTVTEGDDSSISTVTVQTQYNYQATGYIYTETDDGESEIELEFTGGTIYVYRNPSGEVVYENNPLNPVGAVEKIYDNSATAVNGARLENVYLYYYPAYPRESSYSGAGKMISSEEIILKNETSLEKNVYLIKQIDNNISSTKLDFYENSYNVKVNYNALLINLHHNLFDNLAFPDGQVKVPNINGVELPGKSVMLKETSEILLYNVRISLYEEGAAHPADGSDPFPDDMMLLELNGSMND